MAIFANCGKSGGSGNVVSSDDAGTTKGPAQWVQEAYLKAANGEANDNFGRTVAISGDTIVIVASGEDSNQTTITNGSTASADNSASNSGAAYVYKRTGNTWVQEAFIKAVNAEANDFFGYSVGVSGDTIVVGAYGEDNSQTTITNGATASGDNSVSSAGAAYVYKRTGSTWAQEAYLKASNGNANDFFGYTAALSGDTIIVGAVGEDSNQTTINNGTTASSGNSLSDAGAVYVYKRTAPIGRRKPTLSRQT